MILSFVIFLTLSAGQLSWAQDQGSEAVNNENDGVFEVSESKATKSQVEQENAETSDYVQRLMTAPKNPETMQNPASTTQLAITFAGLFAVIGMIFVVAWVVRRLSGGQFGQNAAAIKILATQPLGTKERLCLIDVGGQQVLVGITAQSMQTLMVLDKPVDKALLKPSASWSSAESVNSLFGAKLQSMLKGSEVNEVKQSKVDD
jgi:flagellar protein FliO/FliZ